MAERFLKLSSHLVIYYLTSCMDLSKDLKEESWGLQLFAKTFNDWKPLTVFAKMYHLRYCVKSVRVRSVFPYLNWLQKYLSIHFSIFSPNSGKCGQEKLQIVTLFTHWDVWQGCECPSDNLVNIQKTLIWINFEGVVIKVVGATFIAMLKIIEATVVGRCFTK